MSTELATGEKLEGPLITIGLAKKEGWYTKNGSKWQSMPELMLRYRAAAWFVRAYAPEIAMGLQTAEEVRDTFDLEATEDGSYTVTTDDIKADIAAQPTPAPDDTPTQQQPVTKPKGKKAEATTAPAEAPEEPAAQATNNHFDETLILCPRVNREIDENNCDHCPEREGCPALDEVEQ